ncbi:DODA-type extradiol aromatic ring-opening family dioxygenase [Natronospira elongata]|uniref:DODA-type extradiol aromatic ring-opening family dioxygenase n=1 Tax=Natronospira elongata TaxID=3110268 RepID=UPI0031F934CC
MADERQAVDPSRNRPRRRVAGGGGAPWTAELAPGQQLDQAALLQVFPHQKVRLQDHAMVPERGDAAGALRLGQALAPLRNRGVLVMGSGSLTHNLYEFRRHVDDPEYAQIFADWIHDAVAGGDVDALVHYRDRAPHAERAHPTEEHYLPLLVALGAAEVEETGVLLEGGMTDGTLSMDSFVWGAAPGRRPDGTHQR